MLQQQDEIEDLKLKMTILLSKLAEGELFSPTKIPSPFPKILMDWKTSLVLETSVKKNEIKP
jgi:hypothetical protein